MAEEATRRYRQSEMAFRPTCHVASSPFLPDTFLTASADGQVIVWSFEKRAPVAHLETVFDSGGSRVTAIDVPAAGLLVVAGNWRGPVAGYEVRTGEAIWSRPELRHVQCLSALEGGVVAAGFDRGPLRIIDARNGETLEIVRGVKEAFPVRGETILCVDRNTATVSLRNWKNGEHYWTHAREGFAVLAAEAAADTVLVGEACGPLRALALGGGERWSWRPPEGSHALAVARHQKAGTWTARISFYEQGGADALVTLADDGELLHAVELPRRPRPVFVAAGSALVTTNEVVSVPDGETLWELADGLSVSP